LSARSLAGRTRLGSGLHPAIVSASLPRLHIIDAREQLTQLYGSREFAALVQDCRDRRASTSLMTNIARAWRMGLQAASPVVAVLVHGGGWVRRPNRAIASPKARSWSLNTSPNGLWGPLPPIDAAIVSR